MFAAHRKQRGIATSENPLTLDLLHYPRPFLQHALPCRRGNQSRNSWQVQRPKTGWYRKASLKKNHHPNVPNLKIRRPHLHYEFEKKLKKRKKGKNWKKRGGPTYSNTRQNPLKIHRIPGIGLAAHVNSDFIDTTTQRINTESNRQKMTAQLEWRPFERLTHTKERVHTEFRKRVLLLAWNKYPAPTTWR